MTILDKPFYEIPEVCARWKISERDLTAFVLAGELTLSATVAGLQVIHGVYDEIEAGEWISIPEGRRIITGTIDIERDDAWTILREGGHDITHLKTPKEEYAVIDDHLASGHHLVRRDDLVVSRAEVARFEAAHPQLATTLEASHSAAEPVAATSTSINLDDQQRPGAPTRYDWEGFWVEVCRYIYEEGVPATQGELVRLMLDWFTDTGRRVPDASTLKKKISPLWRQIGPNAVGAQMDACKSYRA